MTTTQAATAINAPLTSDTTRITHPTAIRIARLVWVFVVGLALCIGSINILNYLELTSQVCTLAHCLDNPFALTPRLVSQFAELNLPVQIWAAHILVLDVLLLGGYLVMAGILFARRSDDWVVLLCSGMLVLLSTQTLLANSNNILTSTPALTGLGSLLTVLTLYLALKFMFIFPDGRYIPRWGIYVVYGGITLEVLRRFSGITTHQLFQSVMLMALLLVPGVGGLIYRYRAKSSPLQRQQIKWVLFGGMIGLSGMMLTATVHFMVVLPSADNTLILNFINRLAYYAALLAFPMGIGFSVLRYRVWQVDLVVNKSLVYAALTLVLAVVLFLSIFVLQRLFMLVLGQEMDILATMLGTGMAALAFAPARRRLQHAVDRRIYGLRQDLDALREQAQRRKAQSGSVGKLTGQSLGDYAVGRLIGRGGMGEVYEASDNTRTVAIKILTDGLLVDVEFRQRFLREADILRTLQHPNIVPVHESGSEGEHNYIVMAYLAGEDAQQRLKDSGRLAVDAALPILQDVAAALDYAHARGLVHRDVKPGNIMLVPEDSARGERAILTDFGIVKLADGSTSITGTGLVGTLDYASPEQIMNSGKVDRRADVYGLGVVAYQLLTGALPFKGSIGEVVFAHLQQPAPDPRASVPELSGTVAKAILKALSKAPEDRYASAGEFIAALGNSQSRPAPHNIENVA
jgi:hypothetical protein